jgi:hypothetical protein
MGDSLERYTCEDGRVYTDGDVWLPSVSTVLDEREKAPALKHYLKNTSQAKQDQRTFYTQNRGTLIHYELLSQLVDYEFWSDDEQHSEECLRGKREHKETGLTGGYETWQRYQNDLEWAKETWELLKRIQGITPERLIDVELFVKNEQVGYAGQFDMLYIDPDSNVVLGDIKTGKRVYDKHLLQLTSYANAVDITVDRLEVFRINPDGKTWEVSSSTDWKPSRNELFDEVKELREQLADKRLKDLTSQAKEAGNFERHG